MLIFVKLGGSLITHKNQVCSARRPEISRLVQEIKQAQLNDPELRIILGHGSGSFGHPPAKKYQTRLGVQSEKDWHGFIEVRQQADALHRIVMDELWKAGLDAISFPPSAAATTHNHTEIQWDIEPIKNALNHELLPVVFGDVVFDSQIGGTILSTEEILAYLCLHLPIEKALIASIEKGVWKHAEDTENIFPILTPAEFHEHETSIGNSHAPDVTGGMRSKVEILFSIIKKHPSIQVSIFCGTEKGNLLKALGGVKIGTLLRNK
ncbi:MAG: isopentenyl phosphate kinase [Anaerolineaceae bacterium]